MEATDYQIKGIRKKESLITSSKKDPPKKILIIPKTSKGSLEGLKTENIKILFKTEKIIYLQKKLLEQIQHYAPKTLLRNYAIRVYRDFEKIIDYEENRDKSKMDKRQEFEQSFERELQSDLEKFMAGEKGYSWRELREDAQQKYNLSVDEIPNKEDLKRYYESVFNHFDSSLKDAQEKMERAEEAQRLFSEKLKKIEQRIERRVLY